MLLSAVVSAALETELADEALRTTQFLPVTLNRAPMLRSCVNDMFFASSGEAVIARYTKQQVFAIGLDDRL